MGFWNMLHVNGWLEQRILFESPPPFSFLDIQQLSGVFRGLEPCPWLFFACGHGVPLPPSILQKGYDWRIPSPSLFDIVTPNAWWVVSVHPYDITNHFFSLLRNRFESYTGGGGVCSGENTSPSFLSCSTIYSHIPSLLNCPHHTKAWMRILSTVQRQLASWVSLNFQYKPARARGWPGVN